MAAMHKFLTRAALVAGVCAFSFIGQAGAASLKDSLATIETGPFKDAACQTAVDSLIGTVDGLGVAAISNLQATDDGIEANVALPIGGTWTVHLFGADCSKEVFAFFKPGQDLGLSSIVKSAGALKELDKLGLADQAFILSNTEGGLSAADAPDAVKSALTAATDGNAEAEIEVKPGLTVLGVMDLSRSTYTSTALKFLGLKDAASQKIAVEADLAADMLAALIKGNKADADFTLVGTMPEVTLTLPGNYALPTASLEFLAEVHPDAKEFEMKVEAADEWKSALGISGLNLSDVTIDLKAGDETSGELDGATKVGGQELDVSWVIEKADEGTETEISLTAPEGKTFKIGGIHGLSKVPGIGELGFKELDVSPAGFGGRLIWKGKELDAAVVKMGTGNKPILLMKTETFHLKDIASAVGKTPLGGISIPGMILTLAEGDPGSISMDEVPGVATAILGDLEEKTGSHLTLHQGVGMLGTIDAGDLGAAGKALGAKGEFVLGGTLGGIFGGKPEIDLYAAFPSFSPSKMPKFLRAAKDITPQLTLIFKEAAGIEADIGVDLVTHLKVHDQELELETAATAVIATSGVGLNFSGSLDKWEHAFGLKGFEIDNLAVSVGVDVDGSVSAGFQGHVELKDGKTTFEVIALVTPDPEALGVPKEVVLEVTTNHVSLEGLMDLADVFIGAMGNNPVAKAAKGKGLYHTLQFDKLPLIEYVQYKTESGDLEDVKIYLATPGASDPALDIDGWGVGVEGRMRVAKKDLAQAKVDLGEHGFDLKGEVLLDKLGPLKIKDARVDAAAGLTDLPHFFVHTDAVLFGLEEDITIEFSKEKMAFTEEAKFGQAFTSLIHAEATIADVHNPDFDVALEFKGDLLDTVLGGIEKELNKFIASYEKDAKAAEADLKKAEKKVDDEEKKVDGAIKKAEEGAKKAEKKIDDAIKKVNGIQTDINNKKDKVHDKSHELHKTKWYQVGKAIRLGAEIAGLEIEIGGLYAAKATATAALEVAKAATELTPILFQPAVLAANAAFEIAKGAIKGAELAVEGAEYIFKGLEKLIEAYRNNFKFVEAKFDGSLQALLGNKDIVMDVKFKVFGENVDIDLSFTPTKPENIAKGVGSMVSKLASEAVDGIKHAFFGGGSSHSNSHAQAVAKWAEKNHVTKEATFAGVGWGGQGPGMDIPMKGALYKNAQMNRCLIFANNKLNFSSCDSTKDDHLFRFTPDGDLHAVASGEKAPYCLNAAGSEKGSAVGVAKCNGDNHQKWTFKDKTLVLASGECVAVDKHKKLVLADCKATDKHQQFAATPIADLKKLSETPASTLYSVSFRDEKSGKCVDAADKVALVYDCDDSDYQVFNLNNSSQLRILNNCMRADKTAKNANVYLGKCDGKEQKWTWTGEHMKVKGKDLCLSRGKKIGNPFNIQLVSLDSCKSANAVWELEPSNVDAEGRILPAYHMIRSTTYNRCMEIRTDLQVDQLSAPRTVLWNCNGDFNQSFSFRWNGEIRSLGKCLARDGSSVALKECYRRPSALQITPDFFKTGGHNRNDINHQRWKVRKSGQIQKIGSNLCLSIDPSGLILQASFKIQGNKLVPNPPKKGKPGDPGSLMKLVKCNGKDKNQLWVVENTLPDGTKVDSYKRLAHTVGGKQRCLETSGNSEVRRLVARECSTSQYQQFAVTNYGELRQMGRCVTADKAKAAFFNGVQLDLEECRNEASQKFSATDSGLLVQSTERGTRRCVVEGPVFTPGAELFKHLPKAMQAHMKAMPSFAPVASGPCHFQIKNAQTKKCMTRRGDGALASTTCNKDPEKIDQVMGVVGSKLTFLGISNNKINTPHLWVNKELGMTVPSTISVQAGSDPAAMAQIKGSYDKSGFIYDEKTTRFTFLDKGKKTKSCLGPAKGGKQADVKQLVRDQQALAQGAAAMVGMSILAKTNPTMKKQLDLLKANKDKALKAYETAAAPGALTTPNCSGAANQKWVLAPVPRTTWVQK